jgi:hypothetical protein
MNEAARAVALALTGSTGVVLDDDQDLRSCCLQPGTRSIYFKSILFVKAL